MSTNKLAQACVYCNRKKIKCDFSSGGSSCQTCKDLSINCIRRTRKRPRQSSDQHLPDSREYGQLVEQSQLLTVSSQNLIGPETFHYPPQSSRPAQSPSVTGSQNIEPARYQRLSEYNFTPSNVEPSNQAKRTHSENIDDNRQEASATYIGRAHYISHDTPIDETSSRAYPSYQSNELAGLGDSVLDMFKAFELPARSIRQGLIDSFIHFCYPWTPILSHSDVYSTADEPSLLLSQSMFLAASRASSSPGVLAFATPEQFYQRAKALFFMNHEKNPLSVIKATIMLQWYTPDGPEHVSYDAGEFWLKIGVGIAYQVGLHRDPGIGPHAIMRRRIWWSLVARDALMSVAHGRPRAINPEDNDVRLLQTSDFDDSLAGGADLFIHYATICCILGDLTESCSRNGLSPAKIDHFQSALFRWSRTLPPSLQISHRRPDSHEWVLSAYDLNTRQLHLPYFIGLAIVGRPSTKGTVSAQSILAASFVAGIFDELLIRDDISHLAPIFTRYCVAASFFLISLRPFPKLWEACQSDLRIFRLSLEELGKRWKSAIGGSKALESILNTPRKNHALSSMRKPPWLTRDQEFFFDGYPLELCQMWKPYAEFCEHGVNEQEIGNHLLAPEHISQDMLMSPGPHFADNITTTVPFTADAQSELPDLSFADLLCEGMENWF